MEYINKIAFHLGIRNEEPNKKLANELANANNHEGIKEISEFLFDKNKSIASDCIAVLYHIAYEKPELIQDYLSDFIKLLSSKNNRMVWGSMIALSTIAPLKSNEIYQEIDLILNTMKKGTVITVVWGINTLVKLSIADNAYKVKLLPILFDYLRECRPIDFAKRAETILPIITKENEREIYQKIIDIKKNELSEAQLKKLKKILKMTDYEI